MKNTKYIVEISTNKKNTKYQTVAQIKFKSKYDELDGDDKIEILEAIMRWSREEILNLYPEQD